MPHADQIFRDLLQDIALQQHFTNYDLQLKPVSTSGANYTSHLFTAIISEGEKELNVFAKVAAISEKLRSQFRLKIYDNERFFYTNLTKIYNKLEEKNGIAAEDKLKIPKFYGYADKLCEETIVMENLTASGYCSFDRFKSVDWNYAISAITELTKYHALSLAYQVEDPEGSKKVIESLKFEIPGNDEQMDAKIMNQAIAATREENKEKLKEFLDKTLMDKEVYIKLNEPGRVTVLGHGDFRPSNLMHRLREDGSVETIVVDYQTIRAGCPIVDLLYFIFTGTDSQFREEHYEDLIEHYYSELRASMTRLGLNPDDMYSRDDFEFEMKERIPYGLVIAVYTLPVVTVEVENAPKVDADTGLSDFSIERTSSLYTERLNGVVDDYVKWGII